MEPTATPLPRFPALLFPRQRWLQLLQLGAIVLVGLLVRLALIQSAGYRDDIVIFYDWFKSIAILPPSSVYAQTPGLNYPPMLVVLYELEAKILRWFVPGTPSEYVLNYAVKLPAILADAAGSVLLYGFIRRNAGHAFGLLGASFIALNPVIIYDSAYWGQNDSIPTVLALFALMQVLSGTTVVAWIAITAAIFFKPPVLVLVPLMLLHPFTVGLEARRRRLRDTGLGIVAGLIVAEILAISFFPHPTPFAAARHLIAQSVQFANVFAFTSLNAFNIWALVQPFFSTDTTKILFLSLHRWSDLAFIVVAAAIYWRYLKTRRSDALLEAATLVLLAFFLILTEMHERYLYYAVVFCGSMLFRKPFGYAALILSLTLILNLEYGLTFMYLDDAKATMIDRFEFAPWLAHVCALANLAVFSRILWAFWWPILETEQRLYSTPDRKRVSERFDGLADGRPEAMTR